MTDYKRFLDPTQDYTVSHMERMVESRLNRRGYHPYTSYGFFLSYKEVDGYFLDEKFVYEIDGEQVHRNREEKDLRLRSRIEKLYGVKVHPYSYHSPPTKKRADEITAEIIDNVVGLRRI